MSKPRKRWFQPANSVLSIGYWIKKDVNIRFCDTRAKQLWKNGLTLNCIVKFEFQHVVIDIQRPRGRPLVMKAPLDIWSVTVVWWGSVALSWHLAISYLLIPRSVCYPVWCWWLCVLVSTFWLVWSIEKRECWKQGNLRWIIATL